MNRPAQALYTPPPQRSAYQEAMEEDDFNASLEDSTMDDTPQSSQSVDQEKTPAADANNDVVAQLAAYDITMIDLAALQVEYGETFADEDVPAAEAFAQRKALKHEMGIEYHRMVTTAVNTFHARTRCPTCKQTPITIDYFAMNHSLPKAAWVQWKELCKKMGEQKPEILDEKEWIEYLGEMKVSSWQTTRWES
ncbi:MAG: hypothetical protein CL912_21535 [Deltaproteobacteria bacterium]|nr:hypothetical protein [Deltaproteobacteria bacterium]|tara:strand:- start:570 stop:1151 length:582 start_codon:yes stop_codon:yes gene_type:complete